MRTDGWVQTLIRFNEHPDIRAAIEKEAKFFRHLIADGIAGLSIVGEECNPHGGPSLESAVPERSKGSC
jgi:hypothetical protein